MQIGYIKKDMTRYTAPKLFEPNELPQIGEIYIMQTKSEDNLAKLFTKGFVWL